MQFKRALKHALQEQMCYFRPVFLFFSVHRLFHVLLISTDLQITQISFRPRCLILFSFYYASSPSRFITLTLAILHDKRCNWRCGNDVTWHSDVFPLGEFVFNKFLGVPLSFYLEIYIFGALRSGGLLTHLETLLVYFIQLLAFYNLITHVLFAKLLKREFSLN